MDAFVDNFERRVTAITVQLSNAEKENVSNIAKSSYYRSAIILTCTLVEGLVHNITEIYSRKDNHIISNKKELKFLCSIPEEVFGKNNVVFAKKIDSDSKIGGTRMVTFRELNNYLKKRRFDK